VNAALAANSSALAPVPEKIAVGGGRRGWGRQNPGGKKQLVERIRIGCVAYYKNEIN